MNKKLLSGVLLGAMLVTSAVTFVSCSKDYDDDIDNLENRMNSVESAMSTLQAQVSAAKWITNLSSTTGGFTVTFSDGSSYTITNGKNGAAGAVGKDGNNGKDGTIVSVENGYWVIDGVTTEYLALTGEEVSGKSPYVEDGYWYFYNEEGEAVKSDYKAAGAAYAVQDATTGVYTLYVPDEEGEIQSIELPTAASKISGIAFTNDSYKKLSIYSATWTFNDGNSVISSASAWAGSKTLPADGSVIYGSTGDPVEVQVSPAEVAEDIKAYTLENSKRVALGLNLTAEPYNGLISASGVRAANGNGLYGLSVDPQVVSKKNATALNTLLTAAAGGAVGYAIVADGIYHSAYEVELASGKAPTLDNVILNETSTAVGSTGTISGIAVGTSYAITFDDDEALYDAYMSVPGQYVSAFGLQYDNEAMTIKVTKNPDTSSLNASFPLTVYTVDITGEVNATVLKVNLSTVIGTSTLPAQTVNVGTASSFQYTLSAAGVNSTDAWKINVSLDDTQYEIYEDEDLTTVAGTDVFKNGLLTGVVATGSSTSATTDVNAASRVIYTIDNTKAAAAGLELNKQYYIKTTFVDASNSELNSTVLPVTFVAPAYADNFTVRSGYVKDGAINAYFYTAGSKAVELDRYFSAYPDGDAIALDAETTVATVASGSYAGEYTSADLATLSAATLSSSTTLTLENPTSVAAGKTELGYGEALTVNVSTDNYEGWSYASGEEPSYSFKIKLMSPIYEGSIKSVGSRIDLKAADAVNGALITADDIKGYDYNNNVYNVVPDKYVDGVTNAWTDARITTVSADKDTDNYIDAVTVEPATQVSGSTVLGDIKIVARNLAATTDVSLPVTVTDAWDYVKTSNVTLRIVVE